MLVQCGRRQYAAVLLTIAMLAAGCVRRSTVSQDLGLSGGMTSSKSPKASEAGQAAPDRPVTTVLGRQKQPLFNPLTGDQRIQHLQSRLSLHPQDIGARLALAEAFEDYRLWEQGLEQYTEALRLFPAGSPDTGSAERAVLGLGRCARASGHARDAIPLVQESIKLRPAASSWDELGLLYDAAEDLASGERSFREAVARDSRSARLHNNLGYNLMLQNKMEGAESEFRSALELDPKFTTACNNMGTVLARRGDLQAALQQFQQASADPAAAHNNVAVVLIEIGRYEQARDELVKTLDLQPNFGPAMVNLSLVQERLGGPAERQPQDAKEKGTEAKLPEEKR